MADETRTVSIDFATNVEDMVGNIDAVSSGLKDAAGEMSTMDKVGASMATSAKQAAIQAAAMAAEWVKASIDIATTANKTASTFENVFGPAAGSLSDEVTELAGHMGLAEHEAQDLLLTMGQLGQSMGMTKQESADFASEMFNVAGDLAAFNPNAGNAADVMNAMTKAANGSTKGMAEFGISLKNAEINERALTMSGKETTAMLTQEDKAMAVLALTTEKMGDAQGGLNAAIAAGNTEFKEASADVDDMQVSIGNALMPIKKLAMEGFMILADVLVALEPAIVAIGELLSMVMQIIDPLLPIVNGLATALGGNLSRAISSVMQVLQPFLNLLTKVSSAISNVLGKLGNIGGAVKKATSSLNPFRRHSGGTVPGSPGQDVPMMLQAGETVLPRGAAAVGSNAQPGGGTTINVTVQAGISNPMDTARRIADLLTEYTNATGPIDVKVK